MKQIILLVDDDPDLLRIMRDSLSDAGYEVMTAPDGLKALDVLRSRKPDVIVSDVEMPDMSGFEFCETFRGLPQNAAVPFIFLTAFDSKERQRQARLVGADDFLVKPFDMVELLVMVKTRLARIMQIYREDPQNPEEPKESS